MEIVFDAILSQLKIDDKGGGYLITLSVPETDKEEISNLVLSGKVVFKVVMLSEEKRYNKEEDESSH
jgi:hypothetical protein